MKRVAVVTATRAEYGLLTPLIRRIYDDKDLELDLIVTGMHLSEKYGNTQEFIEKDGFPISHRIGILENGNTAYDISVTMANAIKGFAECFVNDRPDMIFILGDRYEMMAVAVAAMNENIPISHIHGGEVTKGAIDDCIRHAITKMSYLHFTSTQEYRNRVIQLGENPNRVFNVGALGVDNILNEQLLSEKEIRRILGIDNSKYAIGTFHPVTLDNMSPIDEVIEFCEAIRSNSDIHFILTMANADKGGEDINSIISKYTERTSNISLFNNLGMLNYLSAVKYAAFVIGNSSSGIIEAPTLGTPTVNIGNRQDGRILADTVVCCDIKRDDIVSAIKKALEIEHRPQTIYGDGNTSEKIIDITKRFLFDGKIDLRKGFYSV